MITAVIGTPLAVYPGEVHLQTSGGLVYRILVPVSAFSELKNREKVMLYTVLRMKEDRATVFGFLDPQERELFERMISISGVGGKTALSFISAFSLEELTGAINQGDTAKLTSIPGVGKKTAQLIVLKLTGKLDLKTGVIDNELLVLKEDLVSALENLGFSRKNANKTVNTVIDGEGPFDTFEDAFRRVLKQMQRRG